MNAKTKTWSPEQEAIFEYLKSGAGNAIVKARAGTGKTTTIEHGISVAPESRILYAVFNKRNQTEAEEKISDPRVQIKTLHSLGYGFIRRVWSAAKPNDDVEFDRARAVLKAIRKDEDKELVAAVVKAVGFAKNLCIQPTIADFEKILETQDIDTGDISADDFCTFALRAMVSAKERDAEGRISFNDMVWLPVAMNWVRPWFDLVIIDEAQDMNLPQLVMARGACKQGGRVVVVGDDRQAIYGFRGAAQNGMQMMKVTLRAKEFSLTTTYRCARKVVELAATLVPDYKAAPTAPDGIVLTVPDATKAQPGDAILSRLNAPLMPLALKFLRNNIPARIEGRDVGRQITNLIRSMKAGENIEKLISATREWAEKMKARNAARNDKDPERLAKRNEQVDDMSESIIAISEGCDCVSAVVTRIDRLFADSDGNSRSAVVLSTTHKAKGLEWNRVFLLATTYRQTTGTGEEANIYYVAVTRAKSELYLVGATASPVVNQSVPMAVVVREPMVPEHTKPIIAEEPLVPGSELSEFDLPHGAKYYRVGDVRKIDGAEYVCEMVNASRSRWVCLTREQQTVTNRLTDETKTFTKGRRTVSISASYDEKDNSIIRRYTDDEMKDFLSGNARALKRKETTNDGQQEGNTTMPRGISKKKGENPSGSMLKGSAPFIRKQHKAGVPKKEIEKQAAEKYGVWPALFARIWARATGKPRT